MELRRKLYTRGSSYETTIPKPLLFSRDLTKKQVVTFAYDAEKGRWYLSFENEAGNGSGAGKGEDGKKGKGGGTR